MKKQKGIGTDGEGVEYHFAEFRIATLCLAEHMERPVQKYTVFDCGMGLQIASPLSDHHASHHWLMRCDVCKACSFG
eukprot:3902967-Amphidinium_carterae.2